MIKVLVTDVFLEEEYIRLSKQREICENMRTRLLQSSSELQAMFSENFSDVVVFGSLVKNTFIDREDADATEQEKQFLKKKRELKTFKGEFPQGFKWSDIDIFCPTRKDCKNTSLHKVDFHTIKPKYGLPIEMFVDRLKKAKYWYELSRT